MNYKDYEERVQKNIERNKKILDDFENWLKSSGLSDKTIKKHIDNVDLYINDYLNYYDIKAAEEGYLCINDYLGDWFIRKVSWSSEYSLKQNIASLKKFYSYLKERGMIEDSDYDYMIDTIKLQKAKWLRAVNKYYEDDLFY